MKKVFFLALFGISMFILGLYASSQFKFGVPIEAYRWVLTSMFGLFFLLIALEKRDE